MLSDVTSAKRKLDQVGNNNDVKQCLDHPSKRVPIVYNENFTFLNSDDKDLECGICQTPLVKPVVCVHCRNMTCFTCLTKCSKYGDNSDDELEFGSYVAKAGVFKCPICNLLTPASLLAPKYIDKRLEKLHVVCKICENKISDASVLDVIKQDSMVQNPEIEPISTNNTEINQTNDKILITKTQLNTHWKNQCVRLCKWRCGTQVSGSEGQKHHETTECLFAVLPCVGKSFGCKWSGLSTERQNHTEICEEAQLYFLDMKKKEYLEAIKNRKSRNVANENNKNSGAIFRNNIVDNQKSVLSEGLTVGKLVDARDKHTNWWQGSIVEVSEELVLEEDPIYGCLILPASVRVHFDGWSDKYNETIVQSLYTKRLSSIGTHTVGGKIEQNDYFINNGWRYPCGKMC